MYHRRSKNAITRIGTTAPGSNIVYTVFQNANDANNSGIELVAGQRVSRAISLSLNTNVYRNIIGAFTVVNQYPVPVTYSAGRQSAYSGNVKLNIVLRLPRAVDVQLAAIYLARDIIPQGKIAERFSADIGVKKGLQKGKGEFFMNATDIFNTLRIRKDITGNDFKVKSSDYYETQVLRVGYNYKL